MTSRLHAARRAPLADCKSQMPPGPGRRGRARRATNQRAEPRHAGTAVCKPARAGLRRQRGAWPCARASREEANCQPCREKKENEPAAAGWCLEKSPPSIQHRAHGERARRHTRDPAGCRTGTPSRARGTAGVAHPYAPGTLARHATPSVVLEGYSGAAGGRPRSSRQASDGRCPRKSPFRGILANILSRL